MIALQNAAVLPDMEELYNQYYRRIYNYIYGRILHRENAEDLTAEVFIAVYQNLSQMDEGRGSLATWMFAIARNAVRDFSRRSAFRREVSGEVPDVTAPEDNMGKDDSLR
ncbi:MAG: sigma-70 family RNA polymerase sigma factor, partial [Selenomonadaceae bacterium]|nr:sigma-70 family RNA polymerase sigma factor [Selenomonadaceae bacterium]